MVGFENVPYNIVNNILTYLPIQDVVKCEFICKSWKDMIKSSKIWEAGELSDYKKYLISKKQHEKDWYKNKKSEM